jgi:hypothetical protein
MQDIFVYRGREIARIHNGEIIMTSDVTREELCGMLIELYESNAEWEQRSIELSKRLLLNPLFDCRMDRLPD